MFKFFKKLWNDERGNVLVIAAAGLPMVAGAAGLATDTIQWSLWKRQLQRAADSAAIAGVYQRAQDDGATTNAGTAVTTDLDINQQTGLSLDASPTITYPADETLKINQVQVTLEVSQSLPFSSIFMTNAPTIRATARAAGVPTEEFIIVALSDSATKAGISFNGGVDLNLGSQFGLISNSTAANGAVVNGSTNTITAKVIATAGGIEASDSYNVDSYAPGTIPLDDPYASMSFSDFSADMASCTTRKLAAETKNSGNTTWSWADAVSHGYNCFSGIEVLSGTTLEIPVSTPIYINGGDIDIKGTLNATNGNTFVLSNNDPTSSDVGELKVTGSGQFNVDAPASGYWEGIAVYQDPRGSGTHTMTGGSSGIINGAMYFPNSHLDFGGSSTTGTESCTRIVAETVKFHGNGGSNTFKDECTAFGAGSYSGGRRVRLVEAS